MFVSMRILPISNDSAYKFSQTKDSDPILNVASTAGRISLSTFAIICIRSDVWLPTVIFPPMVTFPETSKFP